MLRVHAHLCPSKRYEYGLRAGAPIALALSVLPLLFAGCTGRSTGRDWANPVGHPIVFPPGYALDRSQLQHVLTRAWASVRSSGADDVADRLLSDCPHRLMCLQIDVAEGMSTRVGWPYDPVPIYEVAVLFIGTDGETVKVVTTAGLPIAGYRPDCWGKLAQGVVVVQLPLKKNAPTTTMTRALLRGAYRPTEWARSDSYDASSLYVVRQVSGGRATSYGIVNPAFEPHDITRNEAHLLDIYRLYLTVFEEATGTTAGIATRPASDNVAGRPGQR